MKKAIKISSSVVVLTIVFLSQTFGQDISRLSKSQDLSFKGESQKTEITIKTSKEYNHLVISIEGRLQAGSASFEIIDPKGKVQANFNIKTEEKVSKGEKTTMTTLVKGQIHKSFRNPIIGDWIIRISPKDGTGYVGLEYDQIYHSKADLIEVSQIENVVQGIQSETVVEGREVKSAGNIKVKRTKK